MNKDQLQQFNYWVLPKVWKIGLSILLGANAYLSYQIYTTFKPQPPVNVNASSIIIRDKIVDGKRVVTETFFAPSITHKSLRLHAESLSRDIVKTLFSNPADINQVRVKLSRIQKSIYTSRKNQVYNNLKTIAINKAKGNIETEFKITKNIAKYVKSRKRILVAIEGIYLERNKKAKNITGNKKRIGFSFAAAQELNPNATTVLLMDQMEVKNLSKLSKNEIEGEKL